MGSDWRMGAVVVLRHAGMPFDWLESLGGDASLDAAADRVLRAREVGAGGGRAQQDEAAYAAAFERARVTLEQRLHDLACRPRVREAVFVSNPGMHDGMWASYVRAAHRPPNARWRRAQRQVYTYLQRFCAKNETASFFGPIGYGYTDGTGVHLERDRPTGRAVFIAPWAVRELAGAMLRDRALLPHLTVVAVGAGTAEDLTPDQAAVLAAAGKAGTVSDCSRDAGLGLAATLPVLAELARRSLVVIGPRPTDNQPDLFGALLAEVYALPALPAADGWRRGLARMEDARAALERAAYPQRAACLTRLEQAFTELTGRPARRHAGEVYADRMVSYEETSSPFRLRIGRDVSERLAAEAHDALELSAAYGAYVQQEQRRRVRELLGGDTRESFASYAERTRPADVDRGRFERLPAPPAGLLDDPPATTGARYALPDLCLLASHVDDIATGSYQLVVSRVHHHLLVDSWLGVFHDREPPFDADAVGWLRGTGERLVGLEVSRRNKGFYRFPGPRVRLRGPAAADAADTSLREPRDLTVVAGDGDLRLLDADGVPASLYLPLADQVSYAAFAALSHPQVLHARIGEGQPHTDRVHVGGAVYQRARWRVEIPGLSRLDPAERYLTLRRLARTNGLPRFVFARSASERKPYCIDTCSPFAAELLAHVARQDPALTLEEMLPGPGDLWLTDRQGNRYTCELRVQFSRGGP